MSMPVLRQTVLSLAAGIVLSQTAIAGVPFDQMIVFGASYEDNGQFPDIDFVSLAFPGLVPPPGAGLDGSTVFEYQSGRRWAAQPTGVDFLASVQGQDIDYDDGLATTAASSDVVDLALGLAIDSTIGRAAGPPHLGRQGSGP